MSLFIRTSSILVKIQNISLEDNPDCNMDYIEFEQTDEPGFDGHLLLPNFRYALHNYNSTRFCGDKTNPSENKIMFYQVESLLFMS